MAVILVIQLASYICGGDPVGMAVFDLIAFDQNIVKYSRLLVNNCSCSRRARCICQISFRITDDINAAGTVRSPGTVECSPSVFRHYIPDRILSVIAADIRDLAVFNIDMMIGSAAVRFYTDTASFFILPVIAPVFDAEIIDLPVFLVAQIDCRAFFAKRTVISECWSVRISSVSIDQRLFPFTVHIDNDRSFL